MDVSVQEEEGRLHMQPSFEVSLGLGPSVQSRPRTQSI